MKRLMHLGVAGFVLVSCAGCVSFTGKAKLAYQDAEFLNAKVGVPVAADLVVETPVVEDRDQERDFTVYLADYAQSLQEAMIERMTTAKAFRQAQTVGKPGAYTLSTRLTIRNFRPPRGGALTVLLGGLFAPPLLGLIWSIPVGMGAVDGDMVWELKSPDGRVVATYEDRKLDATDGDLAGNALAEFGSVVTSFEKFVIDASLAARQDVAAAAGRPPARGAPARREGEIVAVFDIEEPSHLIAATVLDQLTDYLATRLTEQAGYQVVPRSQLRDRLREQQKESYQQCYDQGCQIELGRALAAQLSLATKMLRVGDSCALTANLYDLKKETTVRAASVNTRCAESDLMGGIDEIAKKLAAP